MTVAPREVVQAPAREWRCYADYKDSGVEWLEEIPVEWGVRSLKYETRLINGAAFKPLEWGDKGIPIIRIENLNGGGQFNYTLKEVDNRYHVRKGDLLFAWSGNRGTSFGPFIWVQEGLFHLNQHIFRLAGFECELSWLYWMLKGMTSYVEKQAHGIIGLVHITKQDLGAVKVPIVPRDEQRAIAAFLDRETQKIDDLISKRERLIDLLEEKRTALISRAVTKGLNPDVSMKDSGVGWLGEIPEHWTLMALRRLLTGIEQGWSPVAEDREASHEEWGVIKLSAIGRGVFRPGEIKALPQAVIPDIRYEIRAGDLLLTRGNTPNLVGDVCVVPDIRSRLMLSDLVYRLSVAYQKADSMYLAHWLLSRAGRYQIQRDARGSSQSMVKVSQEHIRSWYIALPPLWEQQAIVEYLDRETDKIEALVGKVRNHIEKLREYRTALISAAVTGKIDVRNESTIHSKSGEDG